MNRKQRRTVEKQERREKSLKTQVSKIVEHINLRNAKAKGIEIRQAKAHDSALKERARKAANKLKNK